MGPYFLICIGVFFYFTNDLPTAIKTNIKQQLLIDRKNAEFNQILSSLPQGIMLVSHKSRSDIRRQVQRIEQFDGIDELTAQ